MGLGFGKRHRRTTLGLHTGFGAYLKDRLRSILDRFAIRKRSAQRLPRKTSSYTFATQLLDDGPQSFSEGKENVQDVLRRFFGKPPPKPNEWCQMSELRLKLKLARYKPVGLNGHFQMMMLLDMMNHIYGDEDDTNFEDFLSPNDLAHYRNHVRPLTQQKRSEMPKSTVSDAGAYSYPPSYGIRPSTKQIEEKLEEYYTMAALAEYEDGPDELQTESDFHSAYKAETEGTDHLIKKECREERF